MNLVQLAAVASDLLGDTEVSNWATEADIEVHEMYENHVHVGVLDDLRYDRDKNQIVATVRRPTTTR